MRKGNYFVDMNKRPRVATYSSYGLEGKYCDLGACFPLYKAEKTTDHLHRRSKPIKD